MPFLPLVLNGGPTGTIEVRGQSTRGVAQKSYTLKLDKGQPTFAGTHHLLLNKHPFDLTRLRQKVALDLFKAIPELSAPHASFAHLTIDGRDFGLFTRVDRIDADFLGMPGGFIYQAKDFDFHRRPGVLELDADKLSFETVLEIKGKADHHALLTMLDAVNDPARGAAELLGAYFDKPNYLSWLAANLLVGNLDTGTQNMFLAAPAAGKPWRLVPWDYDQALGWADQPGGAVQPADVPPRYDEGIGLYWRSPLHRRVFQDPALLAELTRRVDELAAGVLAPARVADLSAAAKAVVRPWLDRDPDHAGLPGPISAYDAEVNRLPATIEMRRTLYHEVLGRPMPFDLNTPGKDGKLSWEPAIQLQGEAVRYDVELGTTPDLAHPLLRAKDLADPNYAPPTPLAPGAYYWRVIARSPGGAWQAAHARYQEQATGRLFEGVARFEVGSI